MRQLEVVKKQVGGCQISYDLQLACVGKLEVICRDAGFTALIALNDNHQLLSESVPYVSVELHGQLKKNLLLISEKGIQMFKSRGDSANCKHSR